MMNRERAQEMNPCVAGSGMREKRTRESERKRERESQLIDGDSSKENKEKKREKGKVAARAFRSSVTGWTSSV